MTEISRLPIGSVALGIYDGPHATPPLAAAGPIFLGIQNLTPGGRIDLTDCKFVSEQDFPKWTRRVTPRAGDIVFSYEATLHRYAMIPEDFVGCLGRRLALIRPDRSKVEPRFLLYYLLGPTWRTVIESSVVSGATVDRIPLRKFPSFEVTLPPLFKQKKVVDIISTYDDLIENNRRRIQLLEQSARLLYKEWFVHLRFSGYEKVRIIDGVPEGWHRCTIGDLTQYLNRGITPEYQDSFGSLVLNQRCVRNHHINMNKARHQKREVPPDKHLRFGDILINSTGTGTLGRVAQFIDKSKTCIVTVDTHVTIVRAKPSVPKFYLGSALIHLEPRLAEMGRGATNQTELRRFDIGRLPILLPSESVSREFETLCEKIHHQVHNLFEQIDRLKVGRDILLPRLINGEIAV